MATTNVSITRDSISEEAFVHDKNRGHWANKTEFLLSLISYAIGLGNVWRFPYLCYANGGGAFLVPYFIMLILCGIPLFYMEIIMGQFSSTGMLEVFRMCPILKGTGYTILVINLFCCCYYSVLVTYPLAFLREIFSEKLPWMHCDNPWNTKFCRLVENGTIQTLITKESDSERNIATPAHEFFHYKLLQISDGIEDIGSIVWPLFFYLLITWCIIYTCLFSNIKTVGKAVYLTSICPYIILTVLFVRGITLPGASKGIKFYLQPEWNKTYDLKVLAGAATQIFFSLAVGWGGIINTASYNECRNDPRYSLAIPLINSLTSIYAGFVVFSVLGYLSEQTGIPVADVATSGAGLAFVTYPQVIGMLPLAQLWAAFFFIMIFLLGLGSEFIQVQAVISALIDSIPYLRNHKKKTTLLCCLVFFLLSIIMVTNSGMYILQLLDWYSGAVGVIVVCLVEVIMVSYAYGVKIFALDIEFITGKYPRKFWIISWKYSTPLIMLFILGTTLIFHTEVTYNDVSYPKWAIVFGWCTCAASICCIPIYAIYLLLTKDGTLREKLNFYSTAYDWTPAKIENRLLYEKFRSKKQKQEANQ